MTGVSSEWFRTAFGEGYREVYAHRDADSAGGEARAALALLALEAPALLLDCGCGWGRHLAPLRAAGAAAVGIDLSPVLLADAIAAGLPVTRADWRRLPFGPVFDGVVSFFTSFGYGPTDADDARAIGELGRVLKRGGRLLLDLPNPSQVRRSLVPASTRVAGGLTISERRSLTADGRRMEKTVEVRDANGRRSWSESVRLYEDDELRALLASAAIWLDAIHGGFSGEPRDADAPRSIVMGTRR